MRELAHSVEVGQQPAEIELLVVAGLLLSGGTLLLRRSGISWASIGALGCAAAAFVAAFVFAPEVSTTPIVPSLDPFLSVSEPQPGAVVAATRSVTVAVELENAPLSDGAQLVLLVDVRERETSTSPGFRIRMRPGEHRLTVDTCRPPGSDTSPAETSVLVTAE